MKNELVLKKFLDNVPYEKRFYTLNGTIINNLSELAESIEGMDQLTFSHHVNQERNDFYNWISGVIGDKELADQVKRSSTHEETKRIIENRVHKLKKLSDPGLKQIATEQPIQIRKPRVILLKKRASLKKNAIPKKDIKQVKLKREQIIKPKLINKYAGIKIKIPQSENRQLILDKFRVATIKNYTNKHLIIGGLKDFFLGLFIGIISALIILLFIKF